MNIGTIDRKYKIAAGAGLVMLAGLFYYDYAYKPLREQSGELAEHLRVSAETLALIQLGDYAQPLAPEQLIERINVSTAVYRKQLSRYDSTVVSQTAIISILEQITKCADKAGLDVKVLEPGEQEKKFLYAHIPLELEAETYYSNALWFFSLISGLPLRIERLSISVGERPRVRLKARILIFVR